MSREPRSNIGTSFISSPAPYRSSGPKRLTLNNFENFPYRVKKLPPDANVSAAPNTKLYQFTEKMCFGCVKCRKDNIHSDTIAVDLRQRIILCTMCFTRIIRPRTYRPNRVVPFPSLLSWLDYKPSQVTTVDEDIMNRTAEAVLPSGDRVAAPQLTASADASSRLNSLPAIAVHIAPSHGNSSGLNTRQAEQADKHPCCRVWGVCQYGPTCLFREAPVDLCLGFLMGVCDGGANCRLLHQRIFDLPPTHSRPETSRTQYDFEDEESEWSRWVNERKKSANSAEWQLWNNGPLERILDDFVPAVQVERQNEEENKPVVNLNISDILSALHSI